MGIEEGNWGFDFFQRSLHVTTPLAESAVDELLSQTGTDPFRGSNEQQALQYSCDDAAGIAPKIIRLPTR